jgi:hypothetical protein
LSGLAVIEVSLGVQKIATRGQTACRLSLIIARTRAGLMVRHLTPRLLAPPPTNPPPTPQVFSGLISVMSQNPELCRAMPKFAPSRKEAGPTFPGAAGGVSCTDRTVHEHFDFVLHITRHG